MIKPCGLVCCVAILCPVASVALLVALCSLPRLFSRLCCHHWYLNLACLHASPRPAPNTSLIASSHTSLLPLTQFHMAFVIATATICTSQEDMRQCNAEGAPVILCGVGGDLRRWRRPMRMHTLFDQAVYVLSNKYKLYLGQANFPGSI
jgi:hypothetical protein